MSWRGEHLDFKEQFDLDNDYGLSSFARDVLGIKNVGGGYLVIGVRDKTWEYLGLKSRLPYDTKGLRDKVRKSAGGLPVAHSVTPPALLSTSSSSYPFLVLHSCSGSYLLLSDVPGSRSERHGRGCVSRPPMNARAFTKPRPHGKRPRARRPAPGRVDVQPLWDVP